MFCLINMYIWKGRIFKIKHFKHNWYIFFCGNYYFLYITYTIIPLLPPKIMKCWFIILNSCLCFYEYSSCWGKGIIQGHAYWKQTFNIKQSVIKNECFPFLQICRTFPQFYFLFLIPQFCVPFRIFLIALYHKPVNKK